jgi:hypothetical protein
MLSGCISYLDNPIFVGHPSGSSEYAQIDTAGMVSPFHRVRSHACCVHLRQRFSIAQAGNLLSADVIDCQVHFTGLWQAETDVWKD